MSFNLSNFNVSSAIEIYLMFHGCIYLNFLDIINFDTFNCQYYNDMFNSNNIQFINLFNFSNDIIIAQNTNTTDNIFVCQKENIATNPNAYNCCSFNFIINECNLNFYINVPNEITNNQSQTINIPEIILDTSQEIVKTQISSDFSQETDNVQTQTINYIDIEINTSQEIINNQSETINNTELNIDISHNLTKEQIQNINLSEIILDTSQEIKTYQSLNMTFTETIVETSREIIVPPNYLPTDIPKPSSSNIPDVDPIQSSKSSSKISIGAIIGIIAGVLVVIIGIIIIIICLCRKKNKFRQPPSLNTSSTSINSPEEKKFIFETTSQLKVEITIDIDKTIGELISLYFKTINKTDLIGDKSISFLWSARVFFYDSKIVIRTYISDRNVGNKILVNDVNDKIKLIVNN